MKRVNNSDINFVINPSCVNLANFTIKFYTTNEKYFYIEKNQDDVTTRERQAGVGGVDYIVKLDWSQLITIGKGVMNYKIINNYEDDDRADAEYNTSIERTSDYYIDSNVTVSEEEAESYAQVVAELGDRIDAEIVRSESADTEQSLALNTEIETRQNQVDIILNLIQDISGDTDMTNYYTKSETSGATQISTALDDKLDVSAFTPTDLSNYYTKSETSGASEIANALNDKADKSNTYTKSQVDTAIANVDVSDQLQDYLLISAYTDDSETIAAALNDLNDRKLDSSAYTPTDLTNYYTKSQTSGASEISTALGTKQNQLIAGDNITISGNVISSTGGGGDMTNYYTKSETSGKSEIATALEGKLDTTAYTPTDLTNYYTKSETSGASEIANALNDKADKSNTYTKSETSGATEIASALSSKLDATAYTPTDLTNYYTKSQTSGATELETAFNLKQNTLIAGDNITISGNVISSTSGGGGKAVGGGTNISITTGETADTINCTLPFIQRNLSKGLNLVFPTVFDIYDEPIEGNTFTNNNTSWNLVKGTLNKFGNTFEQAINNNVFGDRNTLEGFYRNIRCEKNFVVGDYNFFGSMASGYGISNSVVFGYYNSPKNNYEYVFGKYNNSVSASTTFGDSGNTLFSVGNGTEDNARHNAFEIRQNGDIYCSDGTNDVKLQDTITATAANTTALGGLKLQQISQSDYDNLGTYDNSTLYIIV